MRVHELAKQLGIESRKLIPELARIGIQVTSHNNALAEGDVQKALNNLSGQGQAKSLEEAPPKARRTPTGEATLPKKPQARGSKGREGAKGKKLASSAVVKEPPKPEKRHILIKRRKEVEDLAPLPEGLEVVAEGVPSIPFSPPPSELVETPPVVELPSGPDVVVVPPVMGPPTSLEQALSPPTLAQPPGVSEAERTRIHSEKKEGEQAIDKGEEKQRKARKPGRPRDADLFAEKYEDAARWQDLRSLPTLRREERVRHAQPTASTEVTKPRKKTVKLTPGITVKEYAELLGQRPAEIVRKLIEVGLPLTLNQPMNLDAGVLIAEGFGITTEVSGEKEGEALLEQILESVGEPQWDPRCPVVTIMGHVDHGKTSLLDAIRKTKVAEQEAGGITQHIGAYTVKVGDKGITFLDTPGHEAFTAMRARGAQATDIVVLVVAADDGVMPQTVEAAHHAQAANVPIIVAVNKIDKPGANTERVKQGLSEHGLIPESWGGQTIYVEVSAKQKLGLEALLDMILLQAEVLELKADIGRLAKGVVLEAKLDRGRGPVATVLVQNGILRVGATFVVGTTSGRVRAMVSHDGKKLVEARPSTPVEVVGLLGMPAAGDQFVVAKDERVARDIAEARKHKQRAAELSLSGRRLTLDDLYARGQEGRMKELSVVIKADVQGSEGVLCEAVEKVSTESVKVQVIHSGVGGITESDVLLASASGAMIVGFYIRPEPKAAALAEREGVTIRMSTVIYNVIADIKAAAEGLLDPTITERILGRAEVRQVFTLPKIGTIAGCYVSDGLITRSSEGVRVLRDLVTVYEGKIGSLRRFKDDVREVQQGYECGIGVEKFKDIKVGDVIEVYVLDKEAARL